MASAAELRAWVGRYHRERCGWGAVYWAAARVTRAASELTQDARQTAVANVLERNVPPDVSTFDDLSRYLTRSAINYVLDWARRERRYGGVFDQDVAARPASTDEGMILDALGKLPPDDQRLIVRARIDGVRLAELADEFLEPGGSLGVRQVKVFRRLKKALARLRREYDAMNEP